MRKTKREKGITLVALVITIIILLILATTSINLAINGGILDKTKYAVDEYSKEEEEHQKRLLEVEYELAKSNGNFNGTYEEYAVEKLYGVKIGDYVAYNEAGFGTYTADTTKGVGRSATTASSSGDKKNLIAGDALETEQLNWRVLGVTQNGEIKLISDNPYPETITLANEEAYLYGPEELDRMCNQLYGNGTDSTGKVVAKEARSLKIEDINELADYDPTMSSSYGDVYSFRFPTREEAMNTEENESPKEESDTLYIQYKKTTDTKWKDITPALFQIFRMPGASSNEAISSSNPGSIFLPHVGYTYNLATYIKQTTNDGKSMLDIISKGTENGDTVGYQFLSSSTYYFYSNLFVFFGIYLLGNDGLSFAPLYLSNGGTDCPGSFCVRPVVILSSDVKIEKTASNNGTTPERACIIK